LKVQKTYTFELAEHIFHNPINDKPWVSDKAIRESFWIPALKKAGVDYRNPYQTRHTYASTMLSVGAHPIWISSQMGHSNTNMLFQRYARWMPDRFPSAGDKIRDFWSRDGHA